MPCVLHEKKYMDIFSPTVLSRYARLTVSETRKNVFFTVHVIHIWNSTIHLWNIFRILMSSNFFTRGDLFIFLYLLHVRFFFYVAQRINTKVRRKLTLQ